MEIQREAYLNQLIERRDNGMIKIVTGIRRCGKSYLLFTIFKRYLLESGVPEDHIIEIALDGIENEELRDPKVCFRYITDAMRGDGPYYLLLDEVQFMPRFEEVLNSLLRMSNIDVYVTGSNSKFLSSDIVTEFRGRGDEIRIHPLSFAEFYSVWDGDFDDAWDEYMLYGGLPQIVNFQNERQKADYLKNIFANVYLKDVIERNRIQNDAEINILVDVLASAIGAPTNPSKIANTFASERQMSYTNKTISQHIDFLADAFLIEKAQRYDIKGRKYIGANLKYYFTDLGLRNARLNFRQLRKKLIECLPYQLGHIAVAVEGCRLELLMLLRAQTHGHLHGGGFLLLRSRCGSCFLCRLRFLVLAADHILEHFLCTESCHYCSLSFSTNSLTKFRQSFTKFRLASETRSPLVCALLSM